MENTIIEIATVIVLIATLITLIVTTHYHASQHKLAVIQSKHAEQTELMLYRQRTLEYVTDQFNRLAVLGAREEMNKVGKSKTILEYLNGIIESEARNKAEQNLLEYVYVFNRIGAGIFNGSLSRDIIYDIWAPHFFRKHWHKYGSLLQKKRNNNNHNAYSYFDWLANEEYYQYKDAFPRVRPHDIPPAM